MNGDNVTFFDSFGVEHIPKEVKSFISNKNIKTNIYRIQPSDLIIYEYFCIGFIDFILKGISKGLLDYANFFPPNKYEKNHNIMQKYFQ